MSSSKAAEIWNKACAHLQDVLHPDVYSRWIAVIAVEGMAAGTGPVKTRQSPGARCSNRTSYGWPWWRPLCRAAASSWAGSVINEGHRIPDQLTGQPAFDRVCHPPCDTGASS